MSPLCKAVPPLGLGISTIFSWSPFTTQDRNHFPFFQLWAIERSGLVRPVTVVYGSCLAALNLCVHLMLAFPRQPLLIDSETGRGGKGLFWEHSAQQ